MKKLITISALILSSLSAQTQNKIDSIPIYLRFPTVPPFSIMTAPDSVKFSKEDLKKKKPVIIIVFSPDCEHCKHFTKDLIAHIELFNKARIIMSSALNFDLIKKFYEENRIAEYPNIIVGRDSNNFLSTFFKVRNFPSIFVYNKKGKFVECFDGSVSIEKISAAL